MIRRIAWFPVALLLLLSCKSSSSTSEPPPENVPAGEVISLAGEVLAVADGRQRALALGDEITGADTVLTGSESEVRIRFYHNGARWELSANKQRRVSKSAAWNAPKGSGERFLSANKGHARTSTAGREAERQSSETSATTMTPEPSPTSTAMALDDTIAVATNEESLHDKASTSTADELQRERARPRTGRVVAEKSAPKRDQPSVETPEPVPTSKSTEMHPDDTSADQPTSTDNVSTAPDDGRKLPDKSVVRTMTSLGRRLQSTKNTNKKRARTSVTVAVIRGTLSADDISLLQTAVADRLAKTKKCTLVSLSANATIEIASTGAVKLLSSRPKRPDSTACFQSALQSWSMKDKDKLKLKKSVRIRVQVQWPE